MQGEVQIKTQQINKHSRKFHHLQNRFVTLLKKGALMLPHFAAQVLLFRLPRHNKTINQNPRKAKFKSKQSELTSTVKHFTVRRTAL